MITGTTLFCLRCGSSYIDVNGWESLDTAILECTECGHESALQGFSVGRVHLDRKTFAAAAADVAINNLNRRPRDIIRRKTMQELNYGRKINPE